MTYSIRFTSLQLDRWLSSHGLWDLYKARARFSTQEAAEQFVRKHFGNSYHHFGIFPNS